MTKQASRFNAASTGSIAMSIASCRRIDRDQRCKHSVDGLATAEVLPLTVEEWM